MLEKPELYISMDVEADGRVPGLSNMLSFGAAAYTLDKELIGTFSRNLLGIPGAAAEPATMDFWARNPEAWELCRAGAVDPAIAMPDFVAWLAGIERGRRKPIFVGYPAVYDFKWIDYYCVRFAGDNPFGFSGCLDAKSYAAAFLGVEPRAAAKRALPRDWFDDGLPHTHVALDDAIEQGAMIINMMRAARHLPPIRGIVRLDQGNGSAPDVAPTGA